MTTQNFKNHPRFVPGFHYVTFSSILATLVIAIILFAQNGFSLVALFYVLLSLSIGFLFFYTRQFATGNQDRIIRMEENSRSIRIIGTELDNKLTRGQIIALRFAEDTEYAELTKKAISQNLSPKEIKSSIQKWKADHHRI